jgi:adenylate kinase family enzyme
MIIHIAGPPGSGKSTLGNYFRDNYKVKVFDIDEIYMNILFKLDKNKDITEAYLKKNLQQVVQNQIDKLIKKHNKIIFVGLNFPDPHVEFRGKMISVKPYKIEIPTTNKFFIDIDDKTLAKQLLKRELQWLLEDDEYFMEYFNGALKKKKLVIDMHLDDNKFWKSMYKNEDNYKFLDKEKIKKQVDKLLNN